MTSRAAAKGCVHDLPCRSSVLSPDDHTVKGRTKKTFGNTVHSHAALGRDNGGSSGWGCIDVKVCIYCRNVFESKGWQCPRCHREPLLSEGYPSLAPEMSNASSGFVPENFKRLAAVEAGNFWFRARNRLIIWALKRYFPQARTFLEIGCGTGFVLSGIEQAVPDLSLSGSEISSSGLAYAAQRTRSAELFQMDARHMPFVNAFDLIGAFDVLEHVDEDDAILAEMNKALTDRGGVILTVPHHKFLWSRADEDARHVRRYTRTELLKKIEAAGFSVVRMTAFVSFLFPLMLAARLRPGARNKNPDVMAELEMHPLPNWVFEKILDAERQIIRAGVDFPFGGSLLLVAKKL